MRSFYRFYYKNHDGRPLVAGTLLSNNNFCGGGCCAEDGPSPMQIGWDVSLIDNILVAVAFS